MRSPRCESGVTGRLATEAVIAVSVAGCAIQPQCRPDSPVTAIAVPAERLRYAPIVPKRPITVDIYCSPESRTESMHVGRGTTPRTACEVGPSAVACLEVHSAAPFARTVELSARPGSGQRFPDAGVAFLVDCRTSSPLPESGFC